MQAARRLYLYAMSGITLAGIATGLVLLLRVVLAGLFPDPSSQGYEGYVPVDDSRERLSQAIAMLGVGTPVWAVHWWLVQRGLREGRSERDAERGSAIRAFYVTGVLLASLLVWVPSAITLLQWVATDLLQAQPEYSYTDPLGSATAGLAGLVIWLYHGLVRRNDLAAGPVDGAAAWLPRLYLYGVAVVALFIALASLGTVITSVVAQTDFGTDTTYASYYLIGQGVMAFGWALVWLGHWTYAGRLSRQPDWRGVEEGRSRTRVAAFVSVIVGAAIMTITGIANVLREVLVLLLPETASPIDGQPAYVVAVLLSTLPWALAWSFHARALRRETAAAESLRALHQERLVSHGVGAAALLLGATGAGWLIGYGLDLLLGGQRTAVDGYVPSYEVARWLPIMVIGLGTWWWFWRRVVARRGADPVGEAGSTIRRTFLYLTLGVALVVALGTAALILYRMVGLVISAGLGGNLISELATPLGSLVAAGAVLLYHGLALRGDQRLVAGEIEATLPEATLPEATLPEATLPEATLPEANLPGLVAEAAAPDAVAPVARASAAEAIAERRTFTLVGASGADLDAALAAARAALPAGVEIVAAEDP